MKQSNLILLFFFLAYVAKSQIITQLQSAISDPQKKVQAIHHYPNSIQDGKCHNVEVASIVVSGNTITIEESWSNWIGAKAKTTLVGNIDNNVATGQWKSSYSSGSWTFDFANNTGKWNKTHTTLNTDEFEDFQKLEFKVVDNKQIRDGFFVCQ